MIRRVGMLVFLLLALVLLTGCQVELITTGGVTQVQVGATPVQTINGDTATVVYVIDGDTIDVDLNGRTERVRYVGVNTPERGEPCYNDATNANAALVQGQTVTLVRDVSDTDRYGRLLRYVYVGGTFVNAELVAEGWAEARRYTPDTAQYDYLENLETAARQANRGCHPTGVFN